ncbi:MAG: helix-turn-helix domain-containing protein [Candidatus Hodarchaeales archaeon]|jgi:Mn-dependent DtxR family transcriptional regulator
MSSSALFGIKLVEVMPPSVQKVYRTLQSGKRMHVGEIESKTRYSPRTVRQALRHLKNAGLISQIPDMMDMRRHYYMTNAS